MQLQRRNRSAIASNCRVTTAAMGGTVRLLWSTPWAARFCSQPEWLMLERAFLVIAWVLSETSTVAIHAKGGEDSFS